MIGLSGMEKQVRQVYQRRKRVEVEIGTLKGWVFTAKTGME